MKIGILTHHYVKNYGAFLQMKGMYETLQRLYPEAEVTVINYVNQKHWRRNIIHILHFRPGVDTLSTYVEKIRQLRTFTKYERSIPRTRPVKTAKEIIDLKLDLIVLGSDEIWNLCGSGYHPLKFVVPMPGTSPTKGGIKLIPVRHRIQKGSPLHFNKAQRTSHIISSQTLFFGRLRSSLL